MKGKLTDGSESKESRGVKPPLLGDTAKNEDSIISNEGGEKEMDEVVVVYGESPDNLYAAYRLLAEFFKEYLDESDQKKKAEGGDAN